MKVLACYSIKGGVGKTAAAVNLAYQFACENKRTLLIDLDPQGASGFYYKVKPKKKFSTANLINKKKTLLDHIRESNYPNLDVLPSKMDYRHIDLDLDDTKNSLDSLGKNLKELKKEYDIVVLDSPPNITLLSENIFNAADTILIPVIPSTLSERTFEQIVHFFSKHKYHFHKLRAFFSMVEKRKIVHKATMEILKKKHKCFLKTIIPRSADVEKMGIHQSPVQCFAAKRVSGIAFKELGLEVLKKL